MITLERRPEINPLDRWPKTLEGFLLVISDPENPLFEVMAAVIESSDCHPVLEQYLVRGEDRRKFCPISRRPREARAWVTKMREKRNGHKGS